MDKRNVIMNPVRMKIIQYLMVNDNATAADIYEELKNVPKTTLYRHINVLESEGIVTVISEKKIRGTIEKTYAINKDELGKKTSKGSDSVTDNAFSFLMNVYGDFVKYFANEDADASKDGVFLRTLDFNLTDEEFGEFVSELMDVFEKYTEISNGKINDGRDRKITVISSPR